MLNRNAIPFDKRGPIAPSGIRIGTPAVTTRGMKEPEMEIVAGMIDEVLKNPRDTKLQNRIKEEVKELCLKFPFYSRIFQL
jgi:glycine hydroxymethyltransferase